MDLEDELEERRVLSAFLHEHRGTKPDELPIYALSILQELAKERVAIMHHLPNPLDFPLSINFCEFFRICKS